MEYQGKEVAEMILKINGDIVGNDWKKVYDWFHLECTCPADVREALATMP